MAEKLLAAFVKKFTTKNLTLFGVLLILGTLGSQAATLFDGNDLTNPDLGAIWDGCKIGLIAIIAKGAASTGGVVPETPEAAKRLELEG